MQIHRCASPVAVYNDKATSGSLRKLELIGELSLGPVGQGMSSAKRHAALQAAVFLHFDVLLFRSGYTRTTLDFDANAGVPFVNQARYVRKSPSGDFVLTWETGVGNTWLITMESGQ